jgi:hypothetical protein
MPMEPNVYGLWFGKQTAKATENTAPAHRAIQVGGDFNIARDDGNEGYSDLTKYGGNTDWINSLVGNGNPAIEATPSETAAMLWLAHGAEVVTAGTNNVWTLAGSPASGVWTLNIFDGNQTIQVVGVTNTVTSGALDTSIEAAMAAAGYGANQVVVAGGPLNTTPITITFSGVGSASKPFYLTKTADTTSPAVTLTNTTPGVRTKHAYVPQITQGHWATFVKRIGTTVIQRQAFIDALIGGFTLESSTANKATRLTPTILSLDPGKVVASDPAAGLPTGVDGKPFLYTEATGTFTVDGFVQAGQSQMTFTVTEDRSPVYGDDAVPYDLAVGKPAVTIGATIVFDATGLAEYNRLVYGTASPATGTKPLRNIPALGSYSFDMKQKDNQGNLTGNELKVTIPGVKWAVPDAPGPNPDGGNTEVALAGSMRPLGGAIQPYTCEVWNGDTAAYAS